MTLTLKLFLHPDGKIPQLGKEGDAGLDAFARTGHEVIQGEIAKVALGFSYAFWEYGEISHNYWIDVRNRSGVGTKSGFVTVAEVGDSNYRGELHYCVVKASPGLYVVNPGDKIAQLLINPFVDPYKIKIEQVNSIEALGASKRGALGFGASGT